MLVAFRVASPASREVEASVISTLREPWFRMERVSFLVSIPDMPGIPNFSMSVCLANGVSIENVAKMLGHSNIKMTQHYAKVLDSSILKDMMNVKSAIVNLG